MLEDIVEAFISRIRKLVITDEKMETIPLAYLMTLPVPDSIKHFMDQEVELWIREEEAKFSSNERFDYDMPEVRMLVDKIFDILKQNAFFRINKFNQLLERAVKLEFNYLVAPHRTLSQFLFKDSVRVSTIEVYDTLKYFFRYEYYKTAISDYFNLKYLREISQDQFEALLDQIDEKAFATEKVETTLKTIKTILNFLSDAQDKEVTTLDLEVLEAAFRDRNLDDYVRLVQDTRRDTDLTELSFGQIEAMLREGVIPLVRRKEAEPDMESVEDIEASKPQVSVADIEVSESTIVVEESEEAEEEYELEEEEYEDEAEELKQETQETPASVADSLADHVARQISSESPLQDLNELITGRKRRKIIKKLFDKSEADFINMIDTLNTQATWKDASRVIDDIFYERGINPYSKEAILFSDTVYIRFFPKDKYVGNEDTYSKF